MKSQWDCLLENLGEWQGSFTRLGPTGEVEEDTPTIVSLEGLNDNQTIRQTIRRFSSPIEEKVLEYSSLNRSVLFFENGAFSQGSIQFGPFSEFGAELGLIWANHRLRLVQLFNRESQLDRLTLIREHRAGSPPSQRLALTLESLLGEWQGEAVTLFPDWRSPEIISTRLQLHQTSATGLTQHLQIGSGPTSATISSEATIRGDRLLFEQSATPVQVLLLPDGASATSPLAIKPGQPFFLEVGWLVEPGLRQRMVRRYGSKGDWVSLTLVTERKIGH